MEVRDGSTAKQFQQLKNLLLIENVCVTRLATPVAPHPYGPGATQTIDAGHLGAGRGPPFPRILALQARN